MNYQHILFDADGTLFDFDRAEAAALCALLREYHLPELDQYLAQYHVINQRYWQRYEAGEISKKQLQKGRFRDFFVGIGEMGIDSVEANERFLELLGECGYLMDGAEEVCRRLAFLTESMSIATNGVAATQYARIGNSMISPYFKHIFVSEEIGYAKPHPRFFEVALRRMGNPDKKSILIVGDSLSADINGGSMAGIDTCWLNRNQEENQSGIIPDYEIHELEEIFTIIKPSW